MFKFYRCELKLALVSRRHHTRRTHLIVQCTCIPSLPASTVVKRDAKQPLHGFMSLLACHQAGMNARPGQTLRNLDSQNQATSGKVNEEVIEPNLPYLLAYICKPAVSIVP